MAYFNKKLILLLISLFTLTGIQASSLKSMYTERRGDNGLVVFFFEKKIPTLNKTDLSSNIKYDFTYVESTDSISMLSTIITPISYRPEKIIISNCINKFEFIPELIYVTPKKNNLEYRLKIQIPFKEWEEIFGCPESFEIDYVFKENNKIISGSYGMKKNSWKDYCEKMNSIINTIKISTNK